MLSIIAETYPQLNLETASIRPEQGQFNNIYILNDALVFRFPRYAESIRTMQRELLILEHIRPFLPLPVPEPLYTGRDWQTPGRAFMGYPLLPGEPLWRETLHNLAEATQRQLAAQLGGFLAALHAIPAGDLADTLPVMDGSGEWEKLFADMRRHLFPLIRPDARVSVMAHFEGYLQRKDLHAFRPVIRHGDFGSSNILFDPKKGEITGIIDWEFAGLGDPAVDLAAVSTYGEGFFQQICYHYPATTAMLERTRFYRGTFALDEALHGLLQNDYQALKDGLSAYL